MVMQVAVVQAFVGGLQARNGEREVSQGERVLLHAHPALPKERPVIPALPGGVEVHQAVGTVRAHAGGLEVPVGHLLLFLLEALPPQGAPVHTGQHHRLPQQHHEHGLLSIPVALLFSSWKDMSVRYCRMRRDIMGEREEGGGRLGRLT